VLAAGLSPKSVTLSSAITTADGGIDAKVTGVPRRQGLLNQGDTHFQIKTGSAFKPWQLSQIRKEILGSKAPRPSKKVLGSSVRECLDNGGLYCLVAFGYDLLPQQQSETERHLTEIFESCGYSNPRVLALGQGHIAGEIEEFPSIFCDLFGFEQDNFRAYREWSKSPAMTLPLEIGEEQLEAIQEIRDALLQNAPTHVRLVGEPGIGKTRLALEALSLEELAPSVLYVPTGEDFQNSQLFRNILKINHPYFLILVIDDCGDEDRTSILSALQSNRNIRLVTIDHGHERGFDSAIKVIECPHLDTARIIAIIRSYVDVPDYDLTKWAELCGGSPRVAHAVGENLKYNPNDILKPPASVPLWERFISGFTKTDSVAAGENRLVLRYIALFTRFGFEYPVGDEARFIAEEVRAANPAITWPRFQAIVRHFQDRRILQGRHTLFIVPRALHVYLWVDFWDQHGRGFDFAGFLNRMPRTMRDWFLRLFSYAHEAEPALAVVRNLLASNRPMSQRDATLSSVTPRLLRYLAEAEPDATLRNIEETYGKWEVDELLAWKDGRQDIVWALEYTAVWAECFQRSVRVLAKMAAAENSNNSNNSRGTLIHLFSVGIGWAGTQATPAQRFPLLRSLVTSRDESMHALGLELAKSWLSTHGGTRTVGPEHQGLRPTIEFWRPQTYGEVFDAWRQAWRLLVDEFKGAGVGRRNAIANTMFLSAPGLIPISAMTEEVLATLFMLAKATDLDKKALTELVIDLLRNRNDGLPEEVMSQIRQLDDIVTGTTLWERISRFVLNSNWNEDYDFSGESVKESAIPGERVDQLAKELMTSMEVFSVHAQDLLRASGHRLGNFGAACGRLAKERSWDTLLSDEMSQCGDALGAEFVAGYLAGMRTINMGRCEEFLLSMLESAAFRKVAVECAWRCGVSDRVLYRMVEMFKRKIVDAGAFNRFVLRSSPDEISEEALNQVVDALLASDDAQAAVIATEVLHDYYVAQPKANKSTKLIQRDRPLKALLKSAASLGGREPMRDFYWGRLAQSLVSQHPTESLALLEAALSSGEMLGHMNSEAAKVLMEILKTNPVESWSVIAKLLDADAVESWRVSSWLLGDDAFEERQAGPSPAWYLPIDAVVEWTRENPKKRGGCVAHFLPRTLDPAAGGLLTARFIDEFSDDERLAGSIASHFWTGGWMGPRSAYLERKRDAARKWLSATESPRIESWLSEFIQSLSSAIESAKIQEEREF
jgi:hypothetical protein